MEASENNDTKKRRLSMEEDPLLIEIKREEVEVEEYQSNYQENSYIQNPFDNPSIYGLAENFSTDEKSVTNQVNYEPNSYQESVQDGRKPRKKVVPLRPGCVPEEVLQALDAEIDSGVSRYPVNTPIQGQQSRISKKLTIKDYIALEKENKKLKEMIVTFTKEAEKMQDKLLFWTKAFKSISEPPPKKSSPKSQPKPELLPKVTQAPLPTKRRRLSRLPTAPKSSKSPGVNSNDNDRMSSEVPYIKRTTKVVNIPEFPITNIRELIDLEKKMRETSYFSNVFDIIYVSFKKSLVEKSVPTLLNHIVYSELFKYFVWKDLPVGKRRLRMMDFPKFISLFLSLSVKLFGQNREPKSVELIVKQVLHSHITNANRRNLPVAQPKVQVVQQVDKPQPPQNSLVVLNYDLNRSLETPPIQIKQQMQQQPVFQHQQLEDPRSSLSEEDMETYFTPETHLQTTEEDDDVQDITPAPESIDIADDSD